jgi:hypothetical protein
LTGLPVALLPSGPAYVCGTTRKIEICALERISKVENRAKSLEGLTEKTYLFVTVMAMLARQYDPILAIAGVGANIVRGTTVLALRGCAPSLSSLDIAADGDTFERWRIRKIDGAKKLKISNVVFRQMGVNLP